nr:DUF6702 family protein [uncultured Carboxylicivirga sp.]
MLKGINYKKQVALLIVFVLPIVGYGHPIKITTGRLDIDSKEKKCRLALNFFADDFESVLIKVYPQQEFDYKQPSVEMKQSIEHYVLNAFYLMINKKNVEFSLDFITIIEDNVCQVNFIADLKSMDDFEKITIKNILLFEAYSKQSNIIHLFIDKKRVGIMQFYPAIPVRSLSL